MLISDATPLIITPWYPTRAQPFAGAFVQQHSDVLSRIYPTPPTVVHVDTFTTFVGNRWSVGAMQRAAESVARRDVGRVAPDGRTHRVPIVVHRRHDLAARAEAYRRFARVIDISALGRVHVHAHVGLYGGVLAAALRPAPAKIILYEHASFLETVLTDSPATAEYERAVAASAAITAVNPVAVELLRSRFPEHRDRMHHLPNAVDFVRFGDAPSPDEQLRRWIYLGNLKPEKGVRKVLDVFLSACAQWPDISLTIVGHGSDESRLRDRAESSAFAERVRMVGARPASEVPGVLADHDLLVHLSEGETFGLAAVEAVASGRPVILSSTNGSEHAIRPIERMVGRIVDQDASVDEIVSRYGDLRNRFGELDLDAGRSDLDRRFGVDAVAARVAELTRSSESRTGAADA